MTESNAKRKNNDIVLTIPITITIPRGRRAIGLSVALAALIVALASVTVLSQGSNCTDPPGDVLCAFLPDTPILASEINSNFSKLNTRIGVVETDHADWSSAGIVYESPYTGNIKYKKIEDIVFLDGSVNGSSHDIQAETVFTLPAGIRPSVPVTQLLSTWGWGQVTGGALLPAGVVIGSDGAVRVQNLESTEEQYLRLSGMHFSTI